MANLSYEILGAGEPLLILHGLFGSRRNWMSLAKPLSEFARVIAVDLRNHGDSEHAATMSFPEMAEDVAQLANRLGLEQVNIIGHSMGGKVAMVFALKYPARTRRLMVLDVAPVQYDSDFERYIDAMRSVPLDRIRTRKEAEDHLASTVSDMTLRQFLLHNLVREGDRFRWRLNLQGIRGELDRIAGFPPLAAGTSYAGPSVFLAGDRSEYLQPAHEPVIRHYFPAAELSVIENAGHWLHADQPVAVLDGVRTLLLNPPYQP